MYAVEACGLCVVVGADGDGDLLARAGVSGVDRPGFEVGGEEDLVLAAEDAREGDVGSAGLDAEGEFTGGVSHRLSCQRKNRAKSLNIRI